MAFTHETWVRTPVRESFLNICTTRMLVSPQFTTPTHSMSKRCSEHPDTDESRKALRESEEYLDKYTKDTRAVLFRRFAALLVHPELARHHHPCLYCEEPCYLKPGEEIPCKCAERFPDFSEKVPKGKLYWEFAPREVRASDISYSPCRTPTPSSPR